MNSENKPSEIARYPSGDICYKQWRNNEGDKHRVDGPAHINYYPDGKVASESWYRDGKLHREDGPALTRYAHDGSISCEEWFINDKHPVDRPGYVSYTPTGSVARELWFTAHNEPIWPGWDHKTRRQPAPQAVEADMPTPAVEAEPYGMEL